MLEEVLLDTGVLGALTHPKHNPIARTWLYNLRHAGIRVRVPEIADYELRRELIRFKSRSGLERLNDLKDRLGCIRITAATWLLAAQLWAQARQDGYATADDKALDGDVLLAAQARILAFHHSGPGEVVIATTNVAHLSRFAVAREWEQVTP